MAFSLSFDDVLIKPCYSDLKSRKEVDLSSKLSDSITLKLPVISSPMDTITEHKMSIQMALNGGIGIIHRFNSIEEQVSEVSRVKRFLKKVIDDPFTIKKLDFNSYAPGRFVNSLNEPDEHGNKKVKYCNILDTSSNNNDKIYSTLKLAYEDTKLKTGCSSFILTDMSKKPIGIVCKRDIEIDEICNNLSSAEIKNYKQELYYVVSDSFDEIDLDEIRIELIKRNFKKCPVVNSEGKLTGLITMKNIEMYKKFANATLDKDKSLMVGAAVGIGDNYRERATRLVEAGVDLICVDVANGHNKYVAEAIRWIKSEFPDITIMAGNVATPEGFEFLAESGADCVRVGIGNGSICSARLMTGCGVSQFSAIKEIAKHRWYTRESRNSPVRCCKIISDGGHCGKIGNHFKALTIGADFIMLGNFLSGTDESPGRIVTRNGRRQKVFRGMASAEATISRMEKQNQKISDEMSEQLHSEGIESSVELKGPVIGLLNKIAGGLRSGYSYTGSRNLEELHNKVANDQVLFTRISSIGIRETQTRV